METPPSLSPVAPPRTAGLATASLVLGILSVTCLSILAAIPALIVGAIALKQISASGGTLGGKGQALAGLIMGIISFALLPLAIAVFAIAASVTLPAVSGAHAKAQEAACLQNVRQCTLACEQYALEHEATLPTTWGEVKNYAVSEMPGPSLLHCRQDSGKAVSYKIVNPGQRLATLGPPAETIIVREVRTNHHGRRAVGFADGPVELHTDAGRPQLSR
jgi:hypothetical protein